jgi:3-deoxy-D-manno-octulosonate 8-phosphate phosphatase (KDO 8-P phosphatase)
MSRVSVEMAPGARREPPLDAALLARAARVRLLTCDVDGVLTDGTIYVDDHGHEFKAYSALDGQGIKMLQRAGIVVAWITGSLAPSVRHRAQRLGVAHVLMGLEHKMAAFDDLRRSLDVPAESCAHIGDDLPDVPLFLASGFAATVPHAPESVKRHAHYVTRREGGRGAVREVAEVVLTAQGRLTEAEIQSGVPAGGA